MRLHSVHPGISLGLNMTWTWLTQHGMHLGQAIQVQHARGKMVYLQSTMGAQESMPWHMTLAVFDISSLLHSSVVALQEGFRGLHGQHPILFCLCSLEVPHMPYARA